MGTWCLGSQLHWRRRASYSPTKGQLGREGERAAARGAVWSVAAGREVVGMAAARRVMNTITTREPSQTKRARDFIPRVCPKFSPNTQPNRKKLGGVPAPPFQGLWVGPTRRADVWTAPERQPGGERLSRIQAGPCLHRHAAGSTLRGGSRCAGTLDHASPCGLFFPGCWQPNESPCSMVSRASCSPVSP